MKDKKFEITDIYDKNINILLGSGASYGLFPTLALGVKEDDLSAVTVETLATKFEKAGDKKNQTLLFMHYYKECIEPVLQFSLQTTKGDEIKTAVINNYKQFLKTVLTILQRRKDTKRCNIYTTNYDGCLSHVADELLNEGTDDFILNDGARGFSRRILQARNFNSYLIQSGAFDRYKLEIPQLNLIHLHGSIYWYQESENIRVDYSDSDKSRLIDTALIKKAEKFSEVLKDSTKKISELPVCEITDSEINAFWEKYNELPIVNPTKWKFHQTLFEEHYYQMLRLLSYDLERPNSVLLTFGFSFADEHIKNLIKRSLANPSLQVYVFCFNEEEKTRIKAIFETFNNVACISAEEGNLDFSRFNAEVFAFDSKKDLHSKTIASIKLSSAGPIDVDVTMGQEQSGEVEE